MTQGVQGSFDIASDVSSFAARIFYSEQYDESTGAHIVAITGISVKSTVYGQSWYPHGTISVDGTAVGTMDNSNPASHSVSLTAGSGWHEVGLYYGSNDFPWNSAEIVSEADGTKTVEITVDFLLYRDSSAPRPSFKGSFALDLTPTARHYVLSIEENTGADAVVTLDGEELEDGATITHGDELTISFFTGEGYKITEQTVNGETHLSGEKHTVTNDVFVSVGARVLGYAIGSGVYHAYIGSKAGANRYVAYIGDKEGKPVLFGQ